MQLLDVIALTKDLPAHGLVRGQVGTIVEVLSPEAFDVEFVDQKGRTYALVTVQGDDMLRLLHAPAPHAS